MSNTQMWITLLDQGASRLKRAAQLFFHPLQLHLELADLLVQFRLEGLLVAVLALGAVLEDDLNAVQELPLPLTDLHWMDLELLRQFCERLGLLGGFQGNLGLEGRRMMLANLCHHASRNWTRNSDEFNILSGPVSRVHYNVNCSWFAYHSANIMEQSGESQGVAEKDFGYKLQAKLQRSLLLEMVCVKNRSGTPA